MSLQNAIAEIEALERRRVQEALAEEQLKTLVRIAKGKKITGVRHHSGQTFEIGLEGGTIIGFKYCDVQLSTLDWK